MVLKYKNTREINEKLYKKENIQGRLNQFKLILKSKINESVEC